MRQSTTPLARHVRLARLSGGVAVAVTLGGILAATLVAPSGTFSWTANALSDLGVPAAGVAAPVFNTALLLGGVVGLPYVVALRATGADGDHGTGVATAVAGLYVLALVGLALVGLYPAGTPLHLPAAVTFFVASTATLTVDGVARRPHPTGRASLALACLSVLVWGSWPAVGTSGLAIPETVGAVAFAAWVTALGPAPTVEGLRARADGR